MCPILVALVLSVPAAGETEWDSRSMKIPIEYNAEKKSSIRQLALYMSLDRGATWAQHSVAQPGQTTFEFTASKNGPCWFTLVIEDTEGKREPADVSKAEPGLKMFIRSTKK